MLSLSGREDPEDDEHPEGHEYFEDHEHAEDHEDGENHEHGREDRERRDGRGHARPVDAHSCAGEDGRPEAFCRRVVPILVMWSVAWVMEFMTAWTACLPRCLSCRPRVRVSAAYAVVAWGAMVASIVTLASARGSIAADMSAAASDEQAADIEVGFGWAFVLAMCCAILHVAVRVVLARTACRQPRSEGVADGEPWPAKDCGFANENAVVSGQPVEHG